MGHAEVTLCNPRYPELKPMTVKALVDSGAVTMCVPDHIALQLKLETMEEWEVTLADGARKTIPYAGPLFVTFDTRKSFCGAMIMGDEVLLGAIAMEDMDVIIHPRSQRLMVNPESPNIPHMKVK
jgi:clan AA aspartic protease